MKNVTLLLSILLGSVLFILLIGWGFSRQLNKPLSRELVRGDSRNATGSAQARVVVVEFSDFQCPACFAVQPLVKQALERYPNDVQLIFRHFPLTAIHSNSRAAAIASEVAASLGKFWEYHDLLFSQQNLWSDLDSKQAQEKFIEYATQVGVDKAQFAQALENKEIEQKVVNDIANGTVLGIPGTPSFYVNEEKVDAVELQQKIADILAQ